MTNFSKTINGKLRKHYDVSAIVPAYNEEKGIKKVINQLQDSLSSIDANYEIIVVDDGSTDKSDEILKKIDDISYIRHPRNIGYGGALKTGIKNAKGKIIIITDGDGTYPNEVIPELVKHIDEYDMVIGERSMKDPNIPLIRKPAKWFIGKLANYLAETEIPDLNSGLRVFKRSVALKYFKILPSGFSFTTTITLAMHCNGYAIKYIPINYGQRLGKSKISPIKDTFNFIQLIFRTIMYFNPLRIFLPIIGIIFSLFIVSAAFDTLVLKNLTEKTVILFLAAVQILAIGLLADLIDKRSS